MKKNLYLFLLFLPSVCFGQGKVNTPAFNQTAIPIAGKAPNGDAIPISVDPLTGNIGVGAVDQSGPALNFKSTIALAGATDRTQLASHAVHQCLFQAPLANAGIVYAGGSTVTNASGVNEGLALAQGDVFGPVSMTDTNEMYFAADNANDVVKAFCK